MTATDREERLEKGDKALKLHEQGLARSAIAERLGVPPHNVAGMLQRARERRARAGGVEA